MIYDTRGLVQFTSSDRVELCNKSLSFIFLIRTMLLDQVFIASLLGFAACSPATIVATDEVPLLGPAFISNFDPSNSRAIQDARMKVPRLIKHLFSEGTLNRTDLAFHIDVFSAATNNSIYSYSHIGKDSSRTLTAGVLNEKNHITYRKRD